MVVVVFISGCLMWVNVELNVFDVFVVVWLFGLEGIVVVDVLFGEYDFKGKLFFLWLVIFD